MKYNYHTHTKRCMHAFGEDEQYVEAAIEAGFDEIGFSDHSPWPFKNFVSDMRMTEAELKGYIESIRALREKYKDKISIKIGFECEFYEPYMPWLKQIVDEYELDYLILGHHFDYPESISVYYGATNNPKDVLYYADQVIKAMKTGMFSYVAHPDLFMRSYKVFDESCRQASKKIIQAAIDNDFPLEYNLLGLKNGQTYNVQNYPYIEFWQMVGEMGAKAVIGFDVHDPKSFFDDDLYEQAKNTLKQLGIEMVESIRMFR